MALSKQLEHRLEKRIAGLLVLFGLPLVGFVGLANEIKETNPVPGDLAILHALHNLSSPLMDTVFVAITTFGSALAVVIGIVLAVTYLVRKGHRRDALFLVTAAGGTAALNLLFKLLFHRVRPSLWQQIVIEKGYSFPSGHAMISCSLALAIMIICWPTRWRRLSIVIGGIYIFFVGLSRLYLGVHYPSDVLGGWLLSIAWIYAVHKIFGAISPVKQKEPALTTNAASSTDRAQT